MGVIFQFPYRTVAEISLTRSKAQAEGIKLLSAQLTPAYLKLRAIEAQQALNSSSNNKIYFVPTGKDGISLNLHLDEEKP